MTKENLDSLLDTSIEDLAELPEFPVYHAGVHKCVFDYEARKIGDNPSLVIKLKLVETVELANPDEDAPMEAGLETEMSYNLANEFGQGRARGLADKFLIAQGKETGTLREAFEPFKGAELTFLTNVRVDKNDKTKKYCGIKDVFFE